MAALKKARFKWKNGIIYDAGIEIARFDPKRMTFSGVALRLRGRPVIEDWALYWSKGDEFKTVFVTTQVPARNGRAPEGIGPSQSHPNRA